MEDLLLRLGGVTVGLRLLLLLRLLLIGRLTLAPGSEGVGVLDRERPLSSRSPRPGRGEPESLLRRGGVGDRDRWACALRGGVILLLLSRTRLSGGGLARLGGLLLVLGEGDRRRVLGEGDLRRYLAGGGLRLLYLPPPPPGPPGPRPLGA